MRKIFIILLMVLITFPLFAQNIFNRNTLITPMALASGSQVSLFFLDSYNIYNLPSYLGLQNKTYLDFSFFQDGFQNDLFNLSFLNANNPLSVYHFGLKFFYNDFSDKDFDYKTYGLTSGFSIKIRDDLFGGISFLLLKNSFNMINNLEFLSSYSLTYHLLEQSYLSIYVKNVGSDITDFGQYYDSFYFDYGLVYNQQYENLCGQVVLNYSKYNNAEINLAVGYNFNFSFIVLSPVISLDYYQNNTIGNGLSYGLAVKNDSLAVEFGCKIIENQFFYSLAFKTFLF